MEWEFSLDQIGEIATRFWNTAGDAVVFAFHGQMGAGKTTFIQALCAAKGVKDVVGSPTFSIINEYEYFINRNDREGSRELLFHMDLYRLQNEEEARQAGVEDTLYSGYCCLVEWPEKASGIFPEKTLHIYLEWVNDKTRRLKIADI